MKVEINIATTHDGMYTYVVKPPVPKFRIQFQLPQANELSAKLPPFKIFFSSVFKSTGLQCNLSDFPVFTDLRTKLLKRACYTKIIEAKYKQQADQWVWTKLETGNNLKPIDLNCCIQS